MRSHDAQRTGRATVNGPRAITEVWRYAAQDGYVINMEPAVVRDGVYFGTWGLIRRHGDDKRNWDKFDGRIYGLFLQDGKERWPPLHPGKTPWAYAYANRSPGEQDRPAGAGLHWSYYNGTVESTPAVDPRSDLMYVGRGDGRLYAIDRDDGKTRWTFATHDPARPGDPEAGGQIIGGAALALEDLVIFATFAAPHRPDPPKLVRHQTNAVYAVDRHSGRMRWRFPRTGSLASPFVAPVAMSNDGRRVYAVTALPHPQFPCELVALNVATGELHWRLDLPEFGGLDIAVGDDDTIYIAGSDRTGLGDKPAAMAVRDLRTEPRIAWGPIALEGPRPTTLFAAGLAIFQQVNHVDRLYVSSTILRESNGRGGKLHRLNPRTGKVEYSWDPEQAKPSCAGGLTDITLDHEGVIYVGVRGRSRMLTTPEIPGRMYALRDRGSARSGSGSESSVGDFEVLWSFEVAGHLDWSSPAIGPDGALYFGSSAPTRPALQFVPQRPDADIPGADPTFYRIRE